MSATAGTLSSIWRNWKRRNEFLKAQVSMSGVLAVAFIGNNWPHSYPRDENENVSMFWIMNLILFIVALATMKHDPNGSSRGIQLLSRNQTEEWKGWMQWAFIMYHYFRARFVYNEIRVFVSAYVFMTGWGNWQYFDKKKDFSVERAVSMWLRINYLPLLLCLVVGTKLDDFYIVPLHTTGFFVTMATAYVAHRLESHIRSAPRRRLAAIGLSLLAHVMFYETRLVFSLQLISDEIMFRFESDRYSTWSGILVGFLWPYFKRLALFYNTPAPPTLHQNLVSLVQGLVGLLLVGFWYTMFGMIEDKYKYNPIHPYVFWIPIIGWLLMRNASKYLTELHSQILEFFGRITLETYVLQFHLLMCRHVKHIPIIIPGSGGSDGDILLKTINMAVSGSIFVATAYYARQSTVSTQESITELLIMVRQGRLNDSETDDQVNKADGGDSSA